MTADPVTLGDLGAATVTLLAVAAFLIGFAKTGIGGVALISVAIFAAVLPSKLSTGAVLGLLLVGDVVAVRTYHAHADWRTLLRLLPAVGVGLALGALFISRVDDTVMRRAIGAVLIALVGLHLVMRRQQARRTDRLAPHPHAATAWGFGSLAGFTTMVANAGGPAMSLYLLAARFGVLGFMGTTSWFFFVLNLIKVPISAGLHLLTWHTLLLDLVLAPAVLAGTWLGRAVIARIDQRLFETLVLITTVLSGVNLLR
jgi:hypothetical protein